MAIDAKLMEILACPECKTKVLETEGSICCTNPECRRRYAITDDIPVMLIDESEQLEQPDFEAAQAKRPA